MAVRTLTSSLASAVAYFSSDSGAAEPPPPRAAGRRPAGSRSAMRSASQRGSMAPSVDLQGDPAGATPQAVEDLAVVLAPGPSAVKAGIVGPRPGRVLLEDLAQAHYLAGRATAEGFLRESRWAALLCVQPLSTGAEQGQDLAVPGGQATVRRSMLSSAWSRPSSWRPSRERLSVPLGSRPLWEAGPGFRRRDGADRLAAASSAVPPQAAWLRPRSLRPGTSNAERRLIPRR